MKDLETHPEPTLSLRQKQMSLRMQPPPAALAKGRATGRFS